MGDPFALGKLISYHRFLQGKSRKQLAIDTGATMSKISNWESGAGGAVVLPPESMLETLARVLCLDIELLKKEYEASKIARDEENQAKRPSKKRRYMPKVGEFSGEIGNRRILRVTNSQLSSVRMGRK